MDNVDEFGRSYINGLTANGDLLIIDGGFTSITTPNRGTVATRHIVQLDTSNQSWQTLGDGMVAGVFAKPSVAPDGTIYILGKGINAGGGVIEGAVGRWDGTRWSSIGGRDGVGALLALEHDLFTGGFFEHYRTGVVDLDVTLGAELPWGYINEPLTLTVRIDNPNSSPASLVSVRDVLPDSFAFDDAFAPGFTGCRVRLLHMTCHLREITANSTVTLSIVVTPTQLGTFTNAATVATAAREYNLLNNADQHTISIVERGTVPTAVQLQSVATQAVRVSWLVLFGLLWLLTAYVIRRGGENSADEQ